MIAWAAALAMAALAAGPPAAEPADWRPAYAELKAHLRALIRLDTSNPPGDEILAARYLQDALRREAIPSEIFRSSGTRGSLVARLKGSGAKRPFLLVCHTDVVPAQRGEWTVDPFGAVEKGGYVYGRGAADIKGMCAAELMTLVLLKRLGAPLERDVIFFAEADEEGGGPDRHLGWLLREHGGAVAAEYGLNEGGRTLWEDGRIQAVDVQAAEKRYLDVRLLARGSAGHASLPRPDNPVYALARALDRLRLWRPPLERNSVVVAYLEATTPPGAAARQSVRALRGPRWKEAARELERLDAGVSVLFRDTAVPTMLSAGYKQNVIPSEASATVNCRLMPGREPGAFVHEMEQAIREPGVRLAYDDDQLPPVGAMPLDTPLFAAIEEAVGALAPGALVAPFMSAWSTDAQPLRARGTILYGLDPPLAAADADRSHGADERISVEALNAYLRLLYRVSWRMAAAR